MPGTDNLTQNTAIGLLLRHTLVAGPNKVHHCGNCNSGANPENGACVKCGTVWSLVAIEARDVSETLQTIGNRLVEAHPGKSFVGEAHRTLGDKYRLVHFFLIEGQSTRQ